MIDVIAILFVVGLAAMVAIPEQDQGKPELRQKALISALEQVRTAIDHYWGDHNASYPSHEDILTLQSSIKPSKTKIGLSNYLNRLPDNPFTNENSVGSPDTPPGESDWIYDASTGTFKANDSAEHRKL